MPRLTNTQVITRALREINVINEVQAPTAEQGAQALSKLNSLMEAWKEDSLDVGYFEQSTTSDTCPIPDYAGCRARRETQLLPEIAAPQDCP